MLLLRRMSWTENKNAIVNVNEKKVNRRRTEWTNLSHFNIQIAISLTFPTNRSKIVYFSIFNSTLNTAFNAFISLFNKVMTLST